MAKHPVPKKKVSQSRTAKRYASFAHKKHVKLKGVVNWILCAACGEPRLNQKACGACGVFRGKSIKGGDNAKKTDKVTKIKA